MDMQKAIMLLNISHFRDLLSRETEATKRNTILRLLSEEETKLAHLERTENRAD